MKNLSLQKQLLAVSFEREESFEEVRLGCH